MIKEIVEWNKIANNNTFNYSLEASMLAEEFAELIIALKNKDKVEAVDGLLDVFWVGIGTLHKLGITPEQIERAFNEINNSNYSKFVQENGTYKAIFNENGKIIKPETFKKPDLSFLES